MVSSISWFAVWKGEFVSSKTPDRITAHKNLVSERVARNFSSPDLRVHIGGDAAYVLLFDPLIQSLTSLSTATYIASSALLA